MRRALPSFHRSAVLLALLAASAAACDGGCGNRKPFGGDLPASATDIREEDKDLFPDWEYYARATMPAADCDALLRNVAGKEGLLPITEHQWNDGAGDWSPGSPPPWWQPTFANGHYHGRKGDVNTCAGCENGMFFYWSGSH